MNWCELRSTENEIWIVLSKQTNKQTKKQNTNVNMHIYIFVFICVICNFNVLCCKNTNWLSSQIIQRLLKCQYSSCL